MSWNEQIDPSMEFRNERESEAGIRNFSPFESASPFIRSLQLTVFKAHFEFDEWSSEIAMLPPLGRQKDQFRSASVTLKRGLAAELWLGVLPSSFAYLGCTFHVLYLSPQKAHGSKSSDGKNTEVTAKTSSHFRQEMKRVK